MKIYESQGPVFNQIEKNDKKNVTGKNDFQTIMDQITSASDNKETTVPGNIQAPFVGGAGIVFKADPIDSTSETENKEAVLGSLKDTLDLVDFYANKLADSSLSSDSLSPLVEQLEQRLDILKGMESSTEMNDKLKTIISDVTSTMGAEIEKFKRGDYV